MKITTSQSEEEDEEPINQCQYCHEWGPAGYLCMDCQEQHVGALYGHQAGAIGAKVAKTRRGSLLWRRVNAKPLEEVTSGKDRPVSPQSMWLPRIRWMTPGKQVSMPVGQRVFILKGSAYDIGQQGIVTRNMRKRCEVTWKDPTGATIVSQKDTKSLILLDDSLYLEHDVAGRVWIRAHLEEGMEK